MYWSWSWVASPASNSHVEDVSRSLVLLVQVVVASRGGRGEAGEAEEDEGLLLSPVRAGLGGLSETIVSFNLQFNLNTVQLTPLVVEGTQLAVPRHTISMSPGGVDDRKG